MDEGIFKELIARIKAGDDTAADQLFIASHEPLFREVDRHMDPIICARFQAEDVVQEVFTAAWAKLRDAEFDNFTAFLGWLKTIATNKMIDIRRHLMNDKINIRREVCDVSNSRATFVALKDRMPSPKSTPSVGARRREATALLMFQLSRLPEDYQQVLRLRFVQGLPVSEIAAQLKATEGAVHMRCSRALKKLNEYMGRASKFLSSR